MRMFSASNRAGFLKMRASTEIWEWPALKLLLRTNQSQIQPAETLSRRQSKGKRIFNCHLHKTPTPKEMPARRHSPTRQSPTRKQTSSQFQTQYTQFNHSTQSITESIIHKERAVHIPKSQPPSPTHIASLALNDPLDD